MAARRCLLALAALLLTPLAPAQVSVTDDRDAFVAGIDVALTQDFESFFAPGSQFAGANFGTSSGGFFLPLVYRATDGGNAQLFGTEFHNGDTVAACTTGDDAEALVELGGLYHAAGLDLPRSERFTPSADTYAVTLFRDGVAVAPPITVPSDTFAGLTSEVPFDSIGLAATTDDGIACDEFFDNVVLGDAAGGPCTPADLAEPFGLFDLADINTFVMSFTTGCP